MYVLWFVVVGSTWFMNRGYMNSMAACRQLPVSVQTPQVNHTQGLTILLYVLSVLFLIGLGPSAKHIMHNWLTQLSAVKWLSRW